MTTTRTIRASLISGHAALAMLALGANPAAMPVAPIPQWRLAAPVSLSISEAPRRLPSSRRTDRALTD